MTLPDHVIVKTGKMPGKSVAVFCGVHGNERAGILVVDRLVKELDVQVGTVYLVYANPPAIERGVRMINANLNRLFTHDAVATSCYEHHRASELMDLLDTCDALLDLHSYPAPYSSDQSVPFAICETAHHSIASHFNVPFVVSGFTEAEEGGSDGYMHLSGKTGICVELGANERPDLFADLGFDIAKTFLALFGCIEQADPMVQHEQKHIVVSVFHKKEHDDLQFVNNFRSFDLIRAGDPIAVENGMPLCAKEDSYIIFPNAERPVGVEAFILARED